MGAATGIGHIRKMDRKILAVEVSAFQPQLRARERLLQPRLLPHPNAAGERLTPAAKRRKVRKEVARGKTDQLQDSSRNRNAFPFKLLKASWLLYTF